MNETTSKRALKRMLPTFEWILVVALLGLFAARALLPAWRTLNTDFPNYYLAAVTSRRAYSDRPRLRVDLVSTAKRP